MDAEIQQYNFYNTRQI